MMFDRGREHSLAIFRAATAALFAACVVTIVGLGERYARSPVPADHVALWQPAGEVR